MLFSGVVAAFAAVTAVVASPIEERASQPDVTGPFALKIHAKYKTYNNKYLAGTHVGAAIDQAVPGGYDKVFYLNSTDGGYYQDGVQYGRLMYNVAYPQVPYMGGLETNISSNVAALWLSVVDPRYDFSFSKTGELLLGGLSRWLGCTTYTAYGPKAGINWQYGTGTPTTPDCQPITIYKL